MKRKCEQRAIQHAMGSSASALKQSKHSNMSDQMQANEKIRELQYKLAVARQREDVNKKERESLNKKFHAAVNEREMMKKERDAAKLSEAAAIQEKEAAIDKVKAIKEERNEAKKTANMTNQKMMELSLVVEATVKRMKNMKEEKAVTKKKIDADFQKKFTEMNNKIDACKQNEEDAFCMLHSAQKERNDLKVENTALAYKVVDLEEELDRVIAEYAKNMNLDGALNNQFACSVHSNMLSAFIPCGHLVCVKCDSDTNSRNCIDKPCPKCGVQIMGRLNLNIQKP